MSACGSVIRVHLPKVIYGIRGFEVHTTLSDHVRGFERAVSLVLNSLCAHWHAH